MSDQPSGSKDIMKIENSEVLSPFDLDKEVKLPSVSDEIPSSMMERRELMKKKHFDGDSGISSKLERLGKNELRHLVLALAEEILVESDNLAGNAGIALEDGNLAASSAISAKRAEVLEKALKAVQTKEMFERERGIDLESPSMEVVFKYFLEKVRGALLNCGVNEHAKDIFFKNLGESMVNWKKELKIEIEAVHAIGKSKKS